MSRVITVECPPHAHEAVHQKPGELASATGGKVKSFDTPEGRVHIIDVPATANDDDVREWIAETRKWGCAVGAHPPVLPPSLNDPANIERKSLRSRQAARLPYLQHTWNEAAKLETDCGERARLLSQKYPRASK